VEWTFNKCLCVHRNLRGMLQHWHPSHEAVSCTCCCLLYTTRHISNNLQTGWLHEYGTCIDTIRKYFSRGFRCVYIWIIVVNVKQVRFLQLLLLQIHLAFDCLLSGVLWERALACAKYQYTGTLLMNKSFSDVLWNRTRWTSISENITRCYMT